MAKVSQANDAHARNSKSASERGSQANGSKGPSARGVDSAVRAANAVIAAALVVFLLAHEALGALSQIVELPTGARWLIWAGVAAIVVHAIVCAATSYWMMTDTVRPPSAHKRNHLVLKWVSGGVLAALACAHAVMGGDPHDAATSAVACALGAALAWHACVGVKSALRDLGRDKQHRNAIRAVIIAMTAVIVAATAFALVR